MTAHAMQGDREECLTAGMNDYISKPIRAAALVQALNKYKQVKESTPHPSIDAQVLQSLRDMAGEDASLVLAEVLEGYLEDAPSRLQAIERAVVAADADALRKSAHALRSLSAIVGGIAVVQLCEALETMGRAGTTAGAETLVMQLQAEYERLKAALQLLG